MTKSSDQNNDNKILSYVRNLNVYRQDLIEPFTFSWQGYLRVQIPHLYLIVHGPYKQDDSMMLPFSSIYTIQYIMVKR